METSSSINGAPSGRSFDPAGLRQLHEAPSSPETFGRELEVWIHRAAARLRSGAVDREDLDRLLSGLDEVYLEETIQGRAYRQPRGYAGDFETIDRIHTRAVAADPRAARWDRFFHEQPAPKAVRNRKRYFQRLVRRAEARVDGPVEVLDLGSGPCRDVREYLDEHPDSRARFTCVDQDPEAIAYGQALCAPYASRVRFVEGNVLRARLADRYSLVWSAGVLDYLEDRLAVRLLRRILGWAAPDGEVVVGNFAPSNPSRDYMEVLGRWYLHYRDAVDLFDLAVEAGLDADRVRIGMEPERVNLFLHVLPERGS